MPTKTFFRRSIWDDNPRYVFDYASRTPQERACIARLAWINAAKLNVPAVAAAQLLAISRAIKTVPAATDARPIDIADYLTSGSAHEAAGIPMLICMLAAETAGDYAPIDRKVIAGLKIINSAARNGYGSIEKIIRRKPTKSSIGAFAKVYINDVLPVWRGLRKTRSAEAVDNYLAAAGSDKERR